MREFIATPFYAIIQMAIWCYCRIVRKQIIMIELPEDVDPQEFFNQMMSNQRDDDEPSL